MTKKHVRALLRKWDAINLTKIMPRNPDKRVTECLELLFSRLQDIQSGLKMEFHNEMILQNKLLNAVKDVDSCKLAYLKTAPDLPKIIADLHVFLADTPPQKKENP